MSDHTSGDDNRTMYWIIGIVVAVLAVIGLITYSGNRRLVEFIQFQNGTYAVRVDGRVHTTCTCGDEIQCMRTFLAIAAIPHANSPPPPRARRNGPVARGTTNSIARPRSKNRTKKK